MNTQHIKPSRALTVLALITAMDAMQDDPELEEVDTLSLMEEAISLALEHLTGASRHTRDNEEGNT
jgi:hypothetical protein